MAMAIQNKETEEFYQDLFTLTSRPEWETFSTYCEDILKNKIETALDLDTLEELHKSKGQAEILRMIVSFRNILETQYQFIESEEQGYYHEDF
jgi:hypothetical protein